MPVISSTHQLSVADTASRPSGPRADVSASRSALSVSWVASVPGGRGRASTGYAEVVVVDLDGQLVDQPGYLGGVGQFVLNNYEVVIGFDLGEGSLPVLADHHEGRQEDRLERDDESQRRPRALLQPDHPGREHDGMQVEEVHRPRERRDGVGNPQLAVLPAPPQLGRHNGMGRCRRLAGSGVSHRAHARNAPGGQPDCAAAASSASPRAMIASATAYSAWSRIEMANSTA